MAEELPVKPFALSPWSWLYRFHVNLVYTYTVVSIFQSAPLSFVRLIRLN
jgi:hypothetical protein